MPDPNLRALKAGDPITEGWIATLVNLVLRSLKVVGAHPVKVIRGPEGFSVSIPPIPQRAIFRLTEALSPGGTCKGIMLARSADATSIIDETDAEEVDLIDDIGDLVGNIGDRAWCEYWCGKWSIIRVQCS